MRRVVIISATALLILAALTAVGTGDTRAASTSVTVTWGPYPMPAAGTGGPGNYETPALNVAQPCNDCYITSIVPDLVYEDGSKANFDNMAMLHHVVVFGTAQPEITCAGQSLALFGGRLFAAGNERTALEFPEGYGLYNPVGGEWRLIMHLMNMMPVERDLYLQFSFTYQPGSDDLRPVTPIWLDADNCGDSEFSVPAGVSDTHWDWTPTITGDLIVSAGHVHDWGINTSLESLTTGEWACNSVAGYEAASAFAPAPASPGDAGHPGEASVVDPADASYVGHIQDMSGCAPLFRMNAGETVRLHTRYSTPAAEDDVMGIMMAFVYETTDPPDWDADGVPDASDNCIAWPNAAQAAPPWSVGADDAECDGYSATTPGLRASEEFLGTDPLDKCADTPDLFDERGPEYGEPPSPWPPDVNDSGSTTLGDMLAFAPHFLAIAGQHENYWARFDLNGDGKVSLSDVLSIAPFFLKSCDA